MQRNEKDKLFILSEDKTANELPAPKKALTRIKETAVYDQTATFFQRAHVILSQTRSDKYEVCHLNPVNPNKPITYYGSFNKR